MRLGKKFVTACLLTPFVSAGIAAAADIPNGTVWFNTSSLNQRTSGIWTVSSGGSAYSCGDVQYETQPAKAWQYLMRDIQYVPDTTIVAGSFYGSQPPVCTARASISPDLGYYTKVQPYASSSVKGGWVSARR